MTQIDIVSIANYIQYNQQPEHFRIVGRLHEELIVVLSDHNFKELTFKALDIAFANVDWSESFTKPLIILHFDFLHTNTMICLHEWLKRKCANIENIGVVSGITHLKNWWQEWCSVMHQKSFFIVELLYAQTDIWFKISNSGKTLNYRPSVIEEKINNLDHYFSFYAGSQHFNERSYVALRVSELIDYCLFDSMYQIPDKQIILDYVEEITYFKDQKTVDLISSLYDKNISNNKFKITAIEQYTRPGRKPALNDFEWSNDRCCFANITRETKQDCPYTIITEKSLAPFWNHLMCIPMGYQSVNVLEQYNFKFPHDIFDYSYQKEKDFHTRISKLIESLKIFVKDNTIENLKNYYSNHLGDFIHNAKIVKDLTDISEQLYSTRI